MKSVNRETILCINDSGPDQQSPAGQLFSSSDRNYVSVSI